jgi:hypothetical protein
MTVLVTDTGFAPERHRAGRRLSADEISRSGDRHLAHTDDPEALPGVWTELTLIRVAFPAFSDGRAFTIARRLRMMGYTGRVAGLGPVIADQYAMAAVWALTGPRSPTTSPPASPAEQWQFRADWRAHDYPGAAARLTSRLDRPEPFIPTQ